MELVTSEAQLNEALNNHPGTPIIVFKHSTQCPISAAAYRQMEAFSNSEPTPVYVIRVIEERPLSNFFAEQFRVRHQSPQAIVMEDGQVQWQASHYDITSKALSQAVHA